MTKAAELKTQACAEIDARRDDIIAIGESILRNPETGFREVKTEQLVARTLNDLDLETQTGLAITGVKAKIAGDTAGPTLALIGELDQGLPTPADTMRRLPECWGQPWASSPRTSAVSSVAL